ncbi:MAG: biotin attachment protein [Chloroflexi bacterium]|nr:biotin attachment protein [Chloroflexota bacterium]MBI1855086.1 biotin attachment protein [Chloroflexota bacterium]MBI2758192.1 biotin attachment protein [Chloroflexota bacterium]MBI3339830.1 biotin attachment protein [Chloroflexota bacterium]
MKYVTTVAHKEYTIEIIDEKHISIDGKIVEVDFESVNGQPVYSMLIDGKSYESYVYQGEEEWQVLLLGRQYPIKVEDERERRLKSSAGGKTELTGEFHLKAPMPGLVVAVTVEEGQQVEKGQVLAILESMKMQNELKSPRAGTVQRIKVKAGESVEIRQTMLSVA